MAKKIRYNVDLSPELNEVVERISEETGSSKSEVFRKALALISVAEEAKHHNEYLGIIDKNNNVKSRIIGL